MPGLTRASPDAALNRIAASKRVGLSNSLGFEPRESGMSYPFRTCLLCTALICAIGPAGYAAQAPAAAPAANAAANTLTVKPVANFVPVTDAIMRAPKPEDWLMYRGNYAGWAYSQLDQINKGNVKNLQPVWS